MSSSTITRLTIGSPSFEDHEMIPQQFTCEGKGINPAFSIQGVPDDAKSLVLIMEDPDTNYGTFTHWIMWNIPVSETIEEDNAPGVQGKNGTGKNKYVPPCPPSGKHRYFFKIFALDAMLSLPENIAQHALENAMQEHVIASGELVGLYEKQKK